MIKKEEEVKSTPADGRQLGGCHVMISRLIRACQAIGVSHQESLLWYLSRTTIYYLHERIAKESIARTRGVRARVVVRPNGTIITRTCSAETNSTISMATFVSIGLHNGLP